MPILKVESLRFSYPGGGFELGPLSFSLEKVGRAILIGPNGSGKSTLLKLLARMLEPANGQIYIGGEDVTEMTMEDAANRISLVFQDIDGMLFEGSVRDEIAFGPGSLLRKEQVEERVEGMLERMDITHLADKHPLLLSRGEKQRVAVASVLSMDPSVLLLDEPTKGLDHALKKKLIETSTTGVTSLVSSNDLELVPIFDWVILMVRGKIVYEGTTMEFLRDLRELPYTRNHHLLRLLSLAVAKGWQLKDGLAAAFEQLAFGE